MTTRSGSKAEPACGEAHEIRCHCGALVARLVEGGVELRCRRCKRSQIVQLEGGAACASK